MNNDLGRMLEELDMESYLDWQGVDYRRASGGRGAQLIVRECPRCGNDKHKVYLNAETGLGNCFSDGEGFNKWSFIKALLGTEDNKAVVRHIEGVARSLGIAPKRTRSNAAVGTIGSAIVPLSIPLPMPDGHNAIYLLERGIDNEMTAYFHLRYCQVGYHHFKDETGAKAKQWFGERILIPVYDLDGSLVTFQGRDITGKAEKKYLFPMMLPGTGRYLLNGQNAYAWRAKHVIVGEGAFDVMATKKAIDTDPELKDAVPVGTFGKHLSAGADDGNDQLRRFRDLRNNGLKRVTILWDGERKAWTAALDAAELLLGIGLSVYVAELPAGKDPNEVDASVTLAAIHAAKRVTRTTLPVLRLKNPYKS